MKYIIILICFCYFTAHSQNTQSYKYSYRILPDTPLDIASVKVDSSFNQRDTTFENKILTSIDGIVKDYNGKAVEYLTVCIDSNGKTVSCNIRERGTFDKVIAPGDYVLITAKVGYKTLQQHFSIKEQSTLHFNITLARAPSLAVINIYSKRKLSKKEINEIKENEFNNKPLKSTIKKKDFFIMQEI